MPRIRASPRPLCYGLVVDSVNVSVRARARGPQRDLRGARQPRIQRRRSSAASAAMSGGRRLIPLAALGHAAPRPFVAAATSSSARSDPSAARSRSSSGRLGYGPPDPGPSAADSIRDSQTGVSRPPRARRPASATARLAEAAAGAQEAQRLPELRMLVGVDLRHFQLYYCYVKLN